jgi:hypothetical protein
MLLDYIKYSSNTLFFTFPPFSHQSIPIPGGEFKKQIPEKKIERKEIPSTTTIHTPSLYRPLLFSIFFFYSPPHLFFPPKSTI